MGKRIDVGCRELEKAFRKHIILFESGTTSSSHFLLLFYAVECGLKSLYLRENRLTDTGKIQDTNLIENCSGHDLGLWAKAVKISAQEGSLGFCLGPVRRNNERWAICKAHQAWRYGAIINRDDEEKIVAWLKNIGNVIQEMI
jgi:hypothetical protein